MPQQARLKVHGQGGVEVELVRMYLADLQAAYNSILAFEITLDGLNRARDDFSPSFYPSEYRLRLLLGPRATRGFHDWPPTAAQIALMIPNSEHLILNAVSLASPGFWEFMGTLNPLEVLRKYLNDRHERRKDTDYRESAEKRRLELENFDRENKVISDRIKIAKELGARDRDLAQLLNVFIHRPLRKLDSYQDKNVIGHTDLSD